MKTFFINNPFLLLIIICILALFLFIFKINDVPPGINGDEASIGYNAALLSQTLRDENRRLLPIFVLTMDGKDWKQPVTIYSTALLFRLLGPSYFLLRFVSVLFILISLILIFYLLKEIWDLKMAIIGVLIFLTTPIVMIQSHLALENIAPVPFVIFWLLMIIKYEKTKTAKYLFYSGVGLGISLYSYNGMRLIMPVLSALTSGYILFLNHFSFKNSLKDLKFFILGLLPFILIIPFVNYKYGGALFANNQPVKISSYQDFLMPYLSAFDLSFLFLTGDTTPYHSTGKHGIYLLITLPLFLLGCFKALHSNLKFFVFVLIAFFLSPILFGFIGTIHRGSRLLAMLPFFVVLVSLGMSTILNFKNYQLKKIILSIVIILFIVNYGDFLKNYWFEYPQKIKNDFSPPIQVGISEVVNKSRELKLTPMIDIGIYQQYKIAAQFFEKAYYDKPIEKWTIGTEVPKGSIIFMRVADALNLEQKGMMRMDLETKEFGLIINSK